MNKIMTAKTPNHMKNKSLLHELTNRNDILADEMITILKELKDTYASFPDECEKEKMECKDELPINLGYQSN